MTDLLVTSTIDFASAITKARAGDRILMAPGTYKGANIATRIWNPANPLQIVSADLGSRAVIQESSWSAVQGVQLADVDLYASQAVQYQAGLQLQGCRDVDLLRPKVRGGGLAAHGKGFGVKVLGCQRVMIKGGDFADLCYGLNLQRSFDVTIDRATIHDFGGDALQYFSCRRLRLNALEIFNSTPDIGAHNDGIQGQDSGATVPSGHIWITDCCIHRGPAGSPFQGIINTNPIAGSFVDMYIAGNLIIGTGMDNGLAPLAGAGLLENNTTVGVGADAVFMRGAPGFTLGVGNQAEAGSYPGGFTTMTRPADDVALVDAWRKAH